MYWLSADWQMKVCWYEIIKLFALDCQLNALLNAPVAQITFAWNDKIIKVKKHMQYRICKSFDFWNAIYWLPAPQPNQSCVKWTSLWSELVASKWRSRNRKIYRFFLIQSCLGDSYQLTCLFLIFLIHRGF